MNRCNITKLYPEMVTKIQTLYDLSGSFLFIKPGVYLSKENNVYIYIVKKKEKTAAILEYVAYLHAAKVKVLTYLLSINNEYIETISIDQENFYNITAAKTVQGERFSWAHFSPDYMREIGKSIAKCHKISINYDKGQPAIPNILHRRRRGDSSKYQKVESLHAAIEGCGFGLIHNDLTFDNFVINRTQEGGTIVTLINFVNCSYTYHVSDIATLFSCLRIYNSVSIFLKTLSFLFRKLNFFNIWKKSCFEYFLEGYYEVFPEAYLPFCELSRQLKLFQKLHKIIEIPRFQKNNYPKQDPIRPRIL